MLQTQYQASACEMDHLFLRLHAEQQIDHKKWLGEISNCEILRKAMKHGDPFMEIVIYIE